MESGKTMGYALRAGRRYECLEKRIGELVMKMRLIDADQMLRDESEAYMRAQVKVSEFTYAVNACVHEKIIQLIADTPTADPVRHGYWKRFTCSRLYGCDADGEPVYRDGSIYYCSRCDRRSIIKEKFCAECGAKMDGGDENADSCGL